MPPVEGEAQIRRIVGGNQLALERRAIRFRFVFLIRKTTEQPVGARKVCVDLSVTLVRTLLFRVGRDQIARIARTIGKRIQILVGEYRLRDGTESARRDLIASKRLTGDRIADRHRDTGEVASSPRVGGHGPDQFAWPIAHERPVVSEKEHLVLDEWPAKRAAEYVL